MCLTEEQVCGWSSSTSPWQPHCVRRASPKPGSGTALEDCWWLKAVRSQEDHQWLSPREMSSTGQFHMRGSASGSEWRWAGSTQYPGFINHPAKAYRQTPSPPSPRQPLGLHRASEMSAQIWVLMQIIISIIFLHLCPPCQGNKAFPLSGSIRLQLVGILDSEPDGLAMLATYVQQAVLCQASIRFLLIWSSQVCMCIYLPDPSLLILQSSLWGIWLDHTCVYSRKISDQGFTSLS